ncbi:MAG: hypothetical protein MZV63_11900 [Marinilabiliales bacterium]|nr:hypothetical protein [Marinilabiliales bacterium]
MIISNHWQEFFSSEASAEVIMTENDKHATGKAALICLDSLTSDQELKSPADFFQ